MGQKRKIKEGEEKTFDLATYKWDDRVFSDLLTRENLLDSDQALNISRSLREEIRKRELQVLTIPLLERIIEDKLAEYGIGKATPLKLESAPFLRKEGPVLSENARTVLERRYLKKDAKGRVIETPEQMFRRVAKHIARAE
ncbi:MAG: ribonucleotide-diphosphate reductase subunit alpha, partial [Deltaproteobacteria bacterium]|nr:ribonucleotide-diphosphate reductase subunit alpha [Deltaproteobacteria bacterium]